jgi:hypothetical protein
MSLTQILLGSVKLLLPIDKAWRDEKISDILFGEES